MFPPSPEVVTETLNGLDFLPTCSAPDCATPADIFLETRPCRCTRLLCFDHARGVAKFHREGGTGCLSCGYAVMDVAPITIPGEVRS